MNNLFSYLLYIYFADSATKLIKVAMKLDDRGSQHVSDLLEDFMEDAALEYLTSLLPHHLSGGVVVAVDELTDTVVMDAKPKQPDAAISGFDIHHLTGDQQKIAATILAAAKAGSSGGCRAFYSPDEWRRRGEEHGCDSELIVVHDGGDLSHALSRDGDSELIEAVTAALESIGYWAEPCTCWYTAVYKSES